MAPSYFIYLLIISHVIYILQSQWISPSSPTMPMNNSLMSVAHHQDTIYLIGGYEARKELLKYNLNANRFIYNQSFFPIDLWELSQWWFQMHDVLYMTSRPGTDYNIIRTYNLVTNTFDNDYLTVPALYHGNHACLTGDHSHSSIYYLGGYVETNFLNTIQILNISNMSWSFGPNMNTERARFSCIVSSNNNLYAIGGPYISSVEYISTLNIQTNTWSYTTDSLTQPLYHSGCVRQHEIVFIIGGLDRAANIYSDKVHVLNSTTNQVSLLNDRLSYPVWASAPIIVNNTLFVFGGKNGTNTFNTWQYISISDKEAQEAIEPTPSPSQTPTTANPKMTSTEETINTSVILYRFEMTITEDEEVMGDMSKFTTSEFVEESTDINYFVVIIIASVGGISCLCAVVWAFIVCRRKYGEKMASDNIKNVSNKNIAPELKQVKEQNAGEEGKPESPKEIGNIYIEENINDNDIYMDNINMVVEGRVDNDRYDDNGIEGELRAVTTVGEEQPRIGDV